MVRLHLRAGSCAGMNGDDVSTVQRRARRAWSWLPSALAVAVVVVASALPVRVTDTTPAALVRLPLELLVLVAVLLVLPRRLRRTRRAVVVVAGALLTVATLLRVLDVGFLQALNRPFDPLIDWRYAGDLVETARASVTGPLGVGLLLLAAAALVAVVLVVPLSVVRLARLTRDHRGATLRTLAVLAPAWVLLSVAGVRVGALPLASDATADYLYAQVARVPSQLRDRREFAQAARTDPLARTPDGDLFTALRGRDVLVVFVESYGRVALDDPGLSPVVDRALASAGDDLRRSGWTARSASLTSPTFGALSWLAHSTLQSGLWVDSQQRYDQLVTTRRETLSSLFGRAGWRTVAVVPANTRDWPQGAFYDLDHVYDSRNIGYRGPRFGYPTMPDQFTLHAFGRLELAGTDRRPVMAEIDLISSHAPWSRTPRPVPQDAVGDGSVFDEMPETLPSEADIWPDPDRVRAAYAGSVAYSLESVSTFLSTLPPAPSGREPVVVVLGDHQPATVVSGEDPGHDVPVSLLTRDRSLVRRVDGWGWEPGLRPGAGAPVWRMDAFRDAFVAAFGPTGDPTGDNGTTEAAAR